MKTTLLIDADVIRYQIAFTNTKSIDWGDDDVAPAEVTNEAKARLDTEDFVEGLLDKFKADDFVLPLSVSTNFRKSLLPTYKANRTGKPKPALWYLVDDVLHDLYGDRIVTQEWLEGDDLLGMRSTEPHEDRRIIVSIDKDMATIPGYFYNPRRPDHGTRKISSADADYFWMYQVLTGDTVDNYKGCPGIGPKKAEAALRPVHEKTRRRGAEAHLAALWGAVVLTYASKGLSEEDALVQARCARILRHGDYNFKTNEVLLWNPMNTPSPCSIRVSELALPPITTG